MRMAPVYFSLLLLLAVSPVRADDDRTVENARKLLGEYSNAIVEVSVVIKIKSEFFGTEEETLSGFGTIIDRSGLVVVSSSDISLDEETIELLGDEDDDGNAIPAEISITRVKIRLPDGTKSVAKIVLQDKDLGLSFVTPVKPLDKAVADKLTVVQLKGESSPAKVLDQVVSITRMGKSLNYEARVYVERISSVITKPRKLYVAGLAGGPVFNSEGVLLGIGVDHAVSGDIVTVPCEDVLELAQQVMKK